MPGQELLRIGDQLAPEPPGVIPRHVGRTDLGHLAARIDVRLAQAGNHHPVRSGSRSEQRFVQRSLVAPRQTLARAGAGTLRGHRAQQLGNPGQTRPERADLRQARPHRELVMLDRQPAERVVVARHRRTQRGRSGQRTRHSSTLSLIQPVERGQRLGERDEPVRDPRVHTPDLLARLRIGLVTLGQRQPVRDEQFDQLDIAARHPPAGSLGRLLLPGYRERLERQGKPRVVQGVEVRGDHQHRVRRRQPLRPIETRESAAPLGCPRQQGVSVPHHVVLQLEHVQRRARVPAGGPRIGRPHRQTHRTDRVQDRHQAALATPEDLERVRVGKGSGHRASSRRRNGHRHHLHPPQPYRATEYRRALSFRAPTGAPGGSDSQRRALTLCRVSG